MSNIIEQREAEIVEEFSLFTDWADKYEYLIDLGKELPLIDAVYKVDDNLIKGCQSRVWMHAEAIDNKVHYTADSDAIITKGLVALMIRVLNQAPAQDIVAAKLDFMDKIGLKEHLSPTRSNGLVSMVKQMKLYALALQEREALMDKVNLETRIISILKTIYDPEIPVDIYELGLIYDIAISESNEVDISMTLTSPSCPVAESLPVEVEEKVAAIEEISKAKVTITFEPPWDKSMMSEEAQFELGFL